MRPYRAGANGRGNSERQLYTKIRAEDVQQMRSVGDGTIGRLARKSSNVVGHRQDEADDAPVVRLGRGGRGQRCRGCSSNASLSWLRRAATQVKGTGHGCCCGGGIWQVALATALCTRKRSRTRARETAGIGEAGRRWRDGKDGERFACACSTRSARRDVRQCHDKQDRKTRASQPPRSERVTHRASSAATSALLVCSASISARSLTASGLLVAGSRASAPAAVLRSGHAPGLRRVSECASGPRKMRLALASAWRLCRSALARSCSCSRLAASRSRASLVAS